MALEVNGPKSPYTIPSSLSLPVFEAIAVSHVQSSPDDAFHYIHPIAICTLGDQDLCERLTHHPSCEGLIVAPLRTENLGIEQIIEFSTAQPALRVLLLCGTDPKQAVGHLPGQSLLALMAHGVDEHRVIVGAQGKRPELKNISMEAIAYFRTHVTVLDHIEETRLDVLLPVIEGILRNPPEGAPPFTGECKPSAPIIEATPRHRWESDPLGYFVIEVSTGAHPLVLKHFDNEGLHTLTIVGKTAKAIYTQALDQGRLSRLDHAAYLGKELMRAELAYRLGRPYIQDRPDFPEVILDEAAFGEGCFPSG